MTYHSQGRVHPEDSPCPSVLPRTEGASFDTESQDEVRHEVRPQGRRKGHLALPIEFFDILYGSHQRRGWGFLLLGSPIGEHSNSKMHSSRVYSKNVLACLSGVDIKKRGLILYIYRRRICLQR